MRKILTVLLLTTVHFAYSQDFEKPFNLIFKTIKAKKLSQAINTIDSLDNIKNFTTNPKYNYYKAIAYLSCYEEKDTADTNDFNYLQNAYVSLKTVEKLDTAGIFKKNTNELYERLGSHLLFNGVEDFNRKQYDRALQEFEKVILINKMPFVNRIDTMAYFNAALSAEKLGDTTKAIQLFEEVVLMNFGGTFPIMELSDIYIATKQYDKATNILETGYQQYPQNTNILNALVNAFLTAGQYDDAKPWIRRIIDIKPNDTLYFTLGSIYDYEHSSDSAEANYQKALVLNPQNTDALYNLGVLYYLKAVEIIKKETDGKSIPKSAKLLLEKSRESLERLFAVDDKNKKTVKILISISKLLKDNKMTKRYTKIYDALK